jgi:alpha-glucuronidase
VAQYAPQLAKKFGDPRTVPEEHLLWFHHLRWDHPMPSGRTLWDELVTRYTRGASEAAAMRRTWEGQSEHVDAERHAQVAAFLTIQEREAKWWRGASIAYFQSLSKRPLPAGIEPPAHDLEHYKSLNFPHAPGHW